MSARQVAGLSGQEALWAIVVTHFEVPGDRLLFMWQRSEPTDAEVSARLLADGYAREDVPIVSVTHAFDIPRRMRRHDKRALAAFVAAGGLGD